MFLWLMVALVALLVGLCIALVVVFLRLGKELEHLGDDSKLSLDRVQQTIRNVQVAVPVAALLKQAGERAVELYKKRQNQEPVHDETEEKQ